MIEHLMSRSLSRNQQGCAAGLIWLHVLYSLSFPDSERTGFPEF